MDDPFLCDPTEFYLEKVGNTFLHIETQETDIRTHFQNISYQAIQQFFTLVDILLTFPLLTQSNSAASACPDDEVTV